MYKRQVYIDSYGGNVDGLAKMVATINEIPNQVITVCMGKAMSAGAILLSCGDYRFCDPFSRVMIHNVGGAAMGDLVDQKASVQEGERLNERFNGMLAKNMGKTYDELLKLFLSAPDNRNLYLSPEEAKNLGIVDAVGAPHIVPQVEWTFYAAPEKKRGMNTVVKDQDADLEAILNALSGKPSKKKSKKKAAKKKVTKKKAPVKATKTKATKKKVVKKKTKKKQDA